MSRYDDIISLPHHRSTTHPPLSAQQRAAQFAPFAALSGYEDMLDESTRTTDAYVAPDEYETETINRTLCALQRIISRKPAVRLTCFVPDKRKSGGSYVAKDGNVKRIDETNKLLILTDGTQIPFANLMELDCPEIQ